MPEELTESVVQPKVPETKDIRSGIKLSGLKAGEEVSGVSW